ncbi:MAG TPA: hypothetical protein VEC94_03360 [Pseudolabrys sp.]|nr:hypothetical protein [Pseudolabrys sp.]
MPADRYFYDVAVYRLSQEEYYSDQDQYIDSVLYPAGDPISDKLREMHRKDPSSAVTMRDHLWRSYGGAWIFNEIIGYIRLHFLGSQIRGEYFSVNKKRLVRTRRKLIEYQTWKLAPEIDIPTDATSQKIFEIILEYLEQCRNELPRRYIDSDLLKTIGPYTNWRALWLDSLPRSQPSNLAVSPTTE